MEWFRQVVIQAVVIAGAAAALFELPWFWAKLFLAVFVLWLIINVGRNPLTWGRRTARVIVVATLPFLIGGVSFRVSGAPELPGGLGVILFHIEQAGNDHLWVGLLLVIACLLFDFFTNRLEASRRNGLWGAELPETADLSLEPDGAAVITCRLPVEGGETGASIWSVKLVADGLWPWRLACAVSAPSGSDGDIQFPATSGEPIVVAAHARVELLVVARAATKHRLLRLWLKLRGSRIGIAILGMSARIRLKAKPDRLAAWIPVKVERVG